MWLNGHEWAMRQCTKVGIGYNRAGQRLPVPHRSGRAGADLRPVVPTDLARRSPLATAWCEPDQAFNRFIDERLASA